MMPLVGLVNGDVSVVSKRGSSPISGVHLKCTELASLSSL